MERRFGGLTGAGIAILAASAFALLLAGFILLAKFAPGNAPEARRDVPQAQGASNAVPRAPAWGGPSAAKEGESWSHKELFAYLNSRGMRWSFAHTAYDTRHGPAVFCKENVSGDDQYQLDHDQSEAMQFTGGFTYSQKRPTADEARDEAGARQDAFSWGRFLFVGPEPSLSRLRSALGAPNS